MISSVRAYAIALSSVFFTLGASVSLAADVLLWPIDSREQVGKPAPDNANWVQFIVANGQSESLQIALPSDYGVGALFYPTFTQSVDTDLLKQSALATGADSAVHVALQPQGIIWTFSNGQSVQTLRTSVTSEGLSLGVSWMKIQLADGLPPGPVVEDLNAIEPLTTESDMALVTPVAIPDFQSSDSVNDQVLPSATKDLSTVGPSNYQHPGLEISLEGVDSFSQLMRLSADLRQLQGVSFAYVSNLTTTMTRMVIGSDLDNDAIVSLLSAQPSLQLIGVDRYQFVPPVFDEPANLEALLGESLSVDRTLDSLPNTESSLTEGSNITVQETDTSTSDMAVE